MHTLTTDDDGKGEGINVDIPKGHATVHFSSGSWMIFPDEAWPRAMAVIREQQGLLPQPKPRTPAEAAPMKYTAKDINKLIESIRSGQPPKLPEGIREKHYRDPALPNLYIRLYNTGAASFVVQWKRLGRQKKKALGDVLVLDRLAAIKAAKELLAKITLGTLDPHEAKRERMRANKVTFATLVPLFLEEKKRKGELRPRTARNWKRFLTGYYFQQLHSLPIDEITRDQIQTRIDHMAIQSGNGAAKIGWIAASVFFKWAIKTGKCPDGHHNPMTNVQPPKQNAPRERVLDDDEIRLIWKTCETWEAKAIHCQQQIKASGGRRKGLRGAEPVTDYPRAVKLLFLTGCRAQEIGDLQWSEVDLYNGELRIQGTRTKNKRELCNPLCGMAVEILRGIERERRPDSDNVFGHTDRPGAGQNLSQIHYKTNERIAKAGHKLTFSGGIARCQCNAWQYSLGDDWQRAHEHHLKHPLKHWTPHDIRRTFRTRLAALGVMPHIAEALVGHVGHRTPMDRVYNRYEYWAEKRQALVMWDANLRAIIAGTAEKIARPRFGEPKKGSDPA